jgi:diaminopimelate decarboxylase
MRDGVLELFPDTAEVGPQGHLRISGLDVMDLAETYGTPLYVYDEVTLRARCRAYRETLATYYPAQSAVAYAAKAYLCTALARLFKAEAAGQGAPMELDVVSGGELYIALQGGFSPARIHLHGNNKSPAELALALDVGVGRIVVDNFTELTRLADLAAQRRSQVAIWLRLLPNVDVDTHAYRKTGLLDARHKPFGFPIATGDAARALQLALAAPYLLPVGLHAHIGSQIFETRPFVQMVAALLDFAAEAQAATSFKLQELSPGGGLGVRYVPTDPQLSVEAYGRAVSDAVVQGCRARGLALPRLVLEPGRSIVGPAGVALYTIGGRRVIPGGRTYVSVDGGMADNVRPALYGARYVAVNLTPRSPFYKKRLERGRKDVTVVGKFCESGDVLIWDCALPELEVGDVLAVPVCGAYNLAMSSNYNGALRPAVVLVNKGRARLMQRRETFEDLVRRDY